ncbi:DUF4003 family protein [Bacillus sp. 03113]|uniref:DUF4003 family protein n=1 Tax=Bacillus sp. 03113 TaxID=2578211 RepID=UPI0011422183|nr:DUF4003 family protein [Bacillus sp. 03113]
MLSEKLQSKVDLYKMIYFHLKNKMKWKISDSRILVAIASLYVINNRSLDLSRFMHLSHYIKNNVDICSTLRSQHRFTVASMLDVRFNNPESKFHECLEIYKKMIRKGFARGEFTYLAAIIMLSNTIEKDIYDHIIDRSLEIYRGMSQKHFFLTSKSDYPLAVLLASRNESNENVLHNIEEIYERLNKTGFSKGNDLQSLSHILSLEKYTDTNLLIDRSIQLYQALDKFDFNPSPMHYSSIGMLALLKDGISELNTIQIMMNQLSLETQFKWNKEMNFMIAVNLLMSTKLDNAYMIETGIYSLMDAIIKAQQTAMLAVVSSSSISAAIQGSDSSPSY